MNCRRKVEGRIGNLSVDLGSRHRTSRHTFHPGT